MFKEYNDRELFESLIDFAEHIIKNINYIQKMECTAEQITNAYIKSINENEESS